MQRSFGRLSMPIRCASWTEASLLPVACLRSAKVLPTGTGSHERSAIWPGVSSRNWAVVETATRIRVNLTVEAWPLLGSLRGWRLGLLAPRIGIDVDDVAVLREAVDEGGEASGTWEDGAPLFVGQIGGDDGGFGFVPTRDDVVKEVGRAVVAGQIAELVADQDVRG